uniref:Uncharacterized protein n=1 Tax=Amphilophus citrinellus TaxID=61819 RepID=A0A3Q0SHJ0_AMPCI
MSCAGPGGGSNDVQWCFSQVKGAIDDDVAEGKIRGKSLPQCLGLLINRRCHV